RAYINHHQIAIAWVAAMMVDVNPDFGRTNRSKRGSQTILNCRVERNCDIDTDSCRRWFGQQFGPRQKRIFFQHTVFIPDADVFAELLKRQCERELTSERVTVRPHMTQDRKVLILAQNPADLLEGRIAHSSSPLRFSRSCKISRTRAPRSIES